MEVNVTYNEDCLDTMAKMAMVNGRDYIGSEISEEYVKIAEKRISEID